MAYDGSFTKESTEAFTISVDFATNCLGTGEGIASYTVAATKISDGSTVTTTVIDSDGNDESAGVVTTFVKAGTHGETYKVTVTATTDSSPAAVHSSDILMTVSDT